MYHDGNLLSDYDKWWDDHESKYNNYNIDKSDFKSFIFTNGFNKGDILFIIGTKPEKIEKGNVIIFEANRMNPIIHRVIEVNQNNSTYTFSTIGDNNPGQLESEKTISSDKLVGKAVIRLAPYLGWVKLIFYEHLRATPERGFCDEN